jgi:hypothetical protein
MPVHTKAQNIGGSSWILHDQIIGNSSLKTVAGKAWRHGATKQRVATTWQHVTRLPRMGWHNKLHPLTFDRIQTHQNFFALSVWVKQDQFERITTVDMPDFVMD